jgi:putative transposase
MESKMTAAEISDALGVAKRTINRWAQTENWNCVQELVGGVVVKKYLFALLPEERQKELLSKELVVSNPAEKSLVVHDPEPVQELSDLKQWQREIFDARCTIYREFERLQKSYGTERGITRLLALVETESLPPHVLEAAKQANARHQGKPRCLSRSTLLRWQSQVKNGGIAALAPLPSKENDSVPEWAAYFIRAYNVPSHPSLRDAMNLMEDILPDHIEMPSYSQVRRFNNNRSAVDKEKGRSSAGSLRRIKGYIQRETEDLQPLEVCMCDGHSFKAKVAHFDHGRPFLPEVCAVIDAKTRVVIGWSAGVAESGQTVADALRHAITVNDKKPEGGTPAIFYTDGGSGNVSKLNSSRITGFYARLGVTHKTGLPGNAQGRGLVERLNKSLWIRAAKKLPTFTGKEMDEAVKRQVYLMLDKSVRKGVQSDILPNWREFLECCQAEVDIYNRTPHSSLPKWNDPETGKKRHMAPLEYWCVHIAKGWRPEPLPEALVNDLFYPQIIKTVQRGAVVLQKNRYSNRNVLEAYHGKQVIVEYDIHDAENVRVRDMQQRLLCVASFKSSKQRFFPKEVSRIALEKRAAGREKLLERHLEDVRAELGTAIDTTLAPLRLTEAEEARATELLESYVEPVEEPVEFDESLLEPLKPHMPEQEFNEELLLERAPLVDDLDGYEIEEEEPLLPEAVIDARRRFDRDEEQGDADNWRNLDGFERYEYLQRCDSVNESQRAWMAYFETTNDYRILQELYRDIEQQK